MFGVQFLSFPVRTTEKCFSRIVKTFPGPDSTWTGLEQQKLKTRPKWLCFAPKTYPQCLGSSSYRFPSVLLRNILVEFWRLCRGRKAPEQTNSKIGPRWINVAPETYQHSLGCSSYGFTSVWFKINQPNFGRLFWVQTPPEQAWCRRSSKSGPYDSVLHPEHTHKVENWAQMTRFCTRNILTLFEMKFLSFPLNTGETCFWRILMTFPCLDTIPEQA